MFMFAFYIKTVNHSLLPDSDTEIISVITVTTSLSKLMHSGNFAAQNSWNFNTV